MKLTLTVADFVKDFVKELRVELSERQVNILELIHLDSTISAKAISEKIQKKICNRKNHSERYCPTEKDWHTQT